MIGRRGTAIALGMLACLLAFELSLGVCVQEDAFISFRYARNLAEGHGLVYNAGERVEGYTNFLWVLLTAGALRLGLDPVACARFLGMGFSVALLLLVWRIARGRDRARGVTGGLVAAAIVAFSPSIAVEAVQGLETVMFAFLVTAGVAVAVAAREAGARGAAAPSASIADRSGAVASAPVGAAAHSRRLAAAAGLLVLAALTRPEGVGVFLLAGLGAVAWRASRRETLLPRAEVAAAALFLALYLAYWVWRFRYYGELLPNTFYAKTGGGWWHVARGLGYEGQFLALNPVVTLLTLWALIAAWFDDRAARRTAGAGARPAGAGRGAITATPAAARPRGAPGTSPSAARPRRAPPSLLSLSGAVIVAGYLLYVAAVGGDFKKTFRFVIPVLPLWALLLDAAVSRRGWPATAGAGRLGRRALTGIVLGAIAVNAAAVLPSTLDWTRARGWDLRRREACGRWLAAHARPGDLLAIHSAGIIPYYSRLPTIDMWGINDRHIAHEKVPGMGRPGRRIGHEKEDTPYVFGRNPTYYVDEVYYVSTEPVADLRRRLFVDPASWPVAARYQERSVPLEIAGDHGAARCWFNFLEARR